MLRRHLPSGEPIDDESADMLSLVFLEEVSGVLDHGQVFHGLEEALHPVARRVQRQHRVRVGP